MKFNWGHGIALFYGIFALSMIFAVLKSRTVDHTLVTPKYYEKDLAYQQHYEKLANSKSLSEPIKVWKDKETKAISIKFPDEVNDIQGKVTFYRPVNSAEDFSVPFELTTEKILEYDTEKMNPGLWTIKIDWQSGQKPYYQEVNINI